MHRYNSKHQTNPQAFELECFSRTSQFLTNCVITFQHSVLPKTIPANSALHQCATHIGRTNANTLPPQQQQFHGGILHGLQPHSIQPSPGGNNEPPLSAMHRRSKTGGDFATRGSALKLVACGDFPTGRFFSRERLRGTE